MIVPTTAAVDRDAEDAVPPAQPGAVAHFAAQPLPARHDGFARGIVVAGHEQQQVALLLPVERCGGGRR